MEHGRQHRAREFGTETHSSADCNEKSRHTCKKEFSVTRSVNDCFTEALQYRKHFLADNSSCYDDEVARCVARLAKRLQVQIKSQTLESFDPISVICFLSNFKLVCDTNRVHKRAAPWLIHFFVKRPAEDALNARIALRSKSRRRQKERTKTTHFKEVKCLLEM